MRGQRAKQKASAGKGNALRRNFVAVAPSQVEFVAPPRVVWFLVAIAVVTLATRFYRPDWYVDRQFHPDERWIYQVTATLSYPDEPERLQYGSFPLYLLATLRQVASVAVHPLDVGRFLIVGGRTLTGILSAATVAAAFLLGRACFGTLIGLLAAAFLSVTVLDIQLSRFFAVDVPTSLLTTLTVFACARTVERRTIARTVLTGVGLGLALASKSSALPMAAPIALAQFLAPSPAVHRRRSGSPWRVLKTPEPWIHLAIVAVVAVGVFFLAMPHAFLDFDQFLRDQNEERRKLVTGQDDVPFTRQYLHTVPVLYYFKNLLCWTQFYPLGLTSLAGLIVSGVSIGRSLRGRRRRDLAPVDTRRARMHAVLLIWVLGYFLVVGGSFAKFNRYMLPMTPVFAILAAEALRVAAEAWASIERIPFRRAFAALATSILVPTAVYAGGFFSIYLRPHPWIAASEWLAHNAVAPSGNPPTVLLNEEWGDDLPVWVPGNMGGNYSSIRWAVQEPDSERKLTQLSSMLARADWVVWADRRAYGTYLRLPERYPLTYGYYSLMRKAPETLGFGGKREFASRPRFLFWPLNDDQADESFTLFDHPHVYLFHNEGRFSAERISAVLRAEWERVQSGGR